MAKELLARGNTLITGGTDNHLMLINVKARGLTGSKVEKMCDALHITLNKNTIVGDKSATTPGGVRVGTPAITTRGYLENDAKEVGRFLDEAIKLSILLQERAGTKKLKAFLDEIAFYRELRNGNIAESSQSKVRNKNVQIFFNSENSYQLKPPVGTAGRSAAAEESSKEQ